MGCGERCDEAVGFFHRAFDIDAVGEVVGPVLGAGEFAIQLLEDLLKVATFEAGEFLKGLERGLELLLGRLLILRTRMSRFSSPIFAMAL